MRIHGSTAAETHFRLEVVYFRPNPRLNSVWIPP